MGTTFCKKKYIRALESVSGYFHKGDVFEVKEESFDQYRIIIDGRDSTSGWFKHRFEEIPNPYLKKTSMTTPLKIEAGKYYKTRGGLKAGPMVPTKEWCGYAFSGYIETDPYCRIFQADGKHGSTNIGSMPDKDLIEEWVEPVVVADFKVGDIIVNSHQNSKRRSKKVLGKSLSHYFVLDILTSKEHLIRIDQTEGWIIAPPPPKAMKVYHNIYGSGAIGGIKYYSLESCKTAVIDPIIYGFLEITVTDDNGKITMESRIIPA